MDRKAVSMWKVTRNLILTDVCAIALYWLIPSVKMLVLPLGVLCAIGYMLWLEESGETGAALLRIWRGNMVLVIVSLAVMAVLVWMG